MLEQQWNLYIQHLHKTLQAKRNTWKEDERADLCGYEQPESHLAPSIDSSGHPLAIHSQRLFGLC